MTLSNNPYLTTRELANLLRIKERKVYDLVATGDIPHSRATGKLLFPKKEIQNWVSNRGFGFDSDHPKSVPNILLGSHDPLLDWAIRESDCGLATYYDGSRDGLKRFLMGEGIATGLHLINPTTQTWNAEEVREYSNQLNSVLIEFSWRERGLIARKNQAPKALVLEDIFKLRVAGRQTGAGAQVLLEFACQQQNMDISKIQYSYVARTETDAAQAITTNQADVAFGLRSVAQQHQLGFVPIAQERFDLLVNRGAWFEPPFQSLLTFLKSPAFHKRATEMTGYDCTGLGAIHLNSP
ncbi:MAG: helix-turn-helix domain-containing protein [Gammaproteobacteria bacterium]|nr:helix-turn-helix domain-containing protein [Gammaproteobacteria bacterium]